jgi:copper chaperone CopZ
VRDAVLKVKGVEVVEIDLGRKLVTITLRDGRSQETKVREAIRKAGHIIA